MFDRVSLSVAPAGEIIVLDLWDGDAPDLHGVRYLRVEPRRWWLFGPAPDIGERGALTPIGGGLIRATLTGPGWRDLLSVSGVFDTNGLTPGTVAATVIHHVPVWLAPTDGSVCEVYFAASYAPALVELWTSTIARSGRDRRGPAAMTP